MLAKSLGGKRIRCFLLVNIISHARTYTPTHPQNPHRNSLANQCWIKVATFAAQLEQYEKAIEKFEHVATVSLENNLTKYSAKQYFLQAGLCHLCKVCWYANDLFLHLFPCNVISLPTPPFPPLPRFSLSLSLTQDVITARKALERYQELDMTFSSTRECQFLKVCAMKLSSSHGDDDDDE